MSTVTIGMLEESELLVREPDHFCAQDEAATLLLQANLTSLTNPCQMNTQ